MVRRLLDRGLGWRTGRVALIGLISGAEFFGRDLSPDRAAVRNISARFGLQETWLTVQLPLHFDAAEVGKSSVVRTRFRNPIRSSNFALTCKSFDSISNYKSDHSAVKMGR